MSLKFKQAMAMDFMLQDHHGEQKKVTYDELPEVCKIPAEIRALGRYCTQCGGFKKLKRLRL